jgi:uncharacterized membrane protein
MKTFISAISKKAYHISEKIAANSINESIFQLIQKENPDVTISDVISIQELNQYRHNYISKCLLNDYSELNVLKIKVDNATNKETLLTQELENDDASKITFGQRIADHVATFGGSWTFIISFGVFLVIWIAINAIILRQKAFDPYPFILLNLILSCIAAMQAPVIMMSQNRQEEKDRERAKKDYLINLKSELEIRVLHEKIDHLILKQQQELFEIQQEQIQLLGDIWKKLEDKK